MEHANKIRLMRLFSLCYELYLTEKFFKKVSSYFLVSYNDNDNDKKKKK